MQLPSYLKDIFIRGGGVTKANETPRHFNNLFQALHPTGVSKYYFLIRNTTNLDLSTKHKKGRGHWNLRSYSESCDI